MSQSPRQALGRGLAALLEGAQSGESLRLIDASQIHPNPYQPRKHFDEVALEELALSIRENGLLQPLLVNEKAPGQYELIAGERRWRAAQRLGMAQVPCRLMKLNTQQMLEVALLENIQRHDLNALEEATGYQQLIDEFHYTQEALAKKVGKSRSHIANMLRLLTLPPEVKSLIEADHLSVGHAKALLAAQDPVALAQKVVAQRLSVRHTERQARYKSPAPSEHETIVQQLSHLVGAPVQLNRHNLTFCFADPKQLESFIEALYRAFPAE